MDWQEMQDEGRARGYWATPSEIQDRIKEREVFARLCDISKAKSELKFSPKINLISGLKKTYNSQILWEDWPKHNKV